MFFTSRPKLNMGLALETTVNSRTPLSLNNRYIPGSGVGASSISSRRAKSVRSEVRYFSNNVSFTPRNVRVMPMNNGASVMVTWDSPEISSKTKNSRVASYTITATPDGNNQVIEPYTITVPFPQTSITIDELLFGVPYRFVVLATTYGGNSDTATVSESISTYTVPGIPSNLVPTIGDKEVSILFDVPSDNGSSINEYCVYIDGAQVPESALSIIEVSEPGKVQINIGNLINGKLYNMCITAKNKAGEGLQSESIDATPLGVPDVPTELSAVEDEPTDDNTLTEPSDEGV
jgi:hypothetical protein